METQSVTPPAPQSQVLAAFNAENWLMELTGNLGVSIKDIPEDVRNDILVSETKNWVNRKFFNWFNNRGANKEIEFTPNDENLFKNIIGIKNTVRYTQAKRNMSSHLASASGLFRDAQTHLERAASFRETIMEMDRETGIDLTNEVKKIVAGGWYKYDSEQTALLNKVQNAENQGLVFTTPTVVCKFWNKAAGVEMDVNLGAFEVLYKPLRNKMTVLAGEDNIDVEGVLHPHISGEGNVCWGNAEQTYINAMNNFEPSKAFLALQVILTNYNDESPYRDLYEFALKRDPKLLEGKEIIRAISQATVWIREDDLPYGVQHVQDSTNNDDGESELKVRLYQDVYEGTNVRAPNTPYYIKVIEGGTTKYVELDEDLVTDWG